MQSQKYTLLIIVFAQFCCTSLWFAGNGVLPQLSEVFQLSVEALGYLTSAVQLGFILGTLLFAIFTISDRLSPSKVFFWCALLGAFINLTMLLETNTLFSLIVIRFGTGFFLAGIYPVGMKIAADYFKEGLGISLGFLVGALVLGTAFPHVVALFFSEISWTWTIIATSTVAVIGGLFLLALVPDGPYRTAASHFDISAFNKVFRNKTFKKAALGYFGHMWELYAFWAFVPIFLESYKTTTPEINFSTSFWSFLIIAVGSLGCIMGGKLSKKLGAKKVATTALLLSGFCCLVSPLLFEANQYVFFFFLLFWGVMVITDSPMFSTLVAQNSNPETKGTALTIVNCIGFAITIVSIQLLSYLQSTIEVKYLFLLLALGPIFGLVVINRK